MSKSIQYYQQLVIPENMVKIQYTSEMWLSGTARLSITSSPATAQTQNDILLELLNRERFNRQFQISRIITTITFLIF